MKRIIQRVAALVIGLGLGAVALAGLESVTHISDLNSSWPLGSDLASTSDDHIRNIKVALKTDFPNITGPVTVTQAQLNAVGASGITGFANPTGTVGLTVANGSAVTAMRSDASPPLQLSITPTWTAVHKFSTSAGTGTESLRIDNSAGDARFGLYSAGTETGLLQSNTNAFNISALGASTTFKLSVNAGTFFTLVPTGALTIAAPSGNNALVTATAGYSFGNTTDNPTYSFLGTGTATFNGGVVGVGATGGAKGAGTINVTGCFVNNVACSTSGVATTGTFTGTVTGMTAGLTGTVNYSVTNSIATMWVITAISGTSNVGTMTMTGLPAAVQPSALVQGLSLVTDSGATAIGSWRISGSTVTFQLNAASAFTTSGTKGILGGWTITYPL